MRHSIKIHALGILSFTHFVNDFYSLLLPIFIPVLILQLGINYFDAGILVSSVAIIGAILQSPVGYWADRYRKRVAFIATGFIFYALGAIILGLSNGFSLLLLSSFFIGLATTTYHPQSTNLITKNFAKKGQALGIHGVGGQLGRFISPILIAWLISTFNWRLAAITLTLPALIAVILCWSTLREPRQRGEKGLGGAITLPILLLVLILGLRGAVFQGIISFLPSFLVEKGSSINIAGLLTGIMLGTGLIAQPLGGAMGDKVSKGKIIFFSLVGLTILFFLFQFVMAPVVEESTLNYKVPIALLIGIGFCIFITFPVGLALSAELTLGERVGTSVGLVFGGGMVLPALTLPGVGYLIDNYGFQTGFMILGVLAVVATLISVLYIRLDLKWRQQE
jgi:FSR family fosmidomycin resistance protein-like MFS transporter